MSLDGDSRALQVDSLEKAYRDRGESVRAVDGVSFTVEAGGFYTLLGPSGCGKTTTLRCVAGLERTDEGRITVAGQVVSSTRPRVFVPPHKRDMGMVFQSYAIWPHMTVFENAAFPLRVTKTGLNRAQLKERVEEALATVRLAGYEDRLATRLSGGQQQRLALARALVRRPKLLLLDEPLSNLDAKLRERMRSEVRDLQRGLGITALYVTHDQAEALSMSDRIAVMSNGKIVQEGRPREIYQRPATQFVADFVGNANFIPATVMAVGTSGMSQLQTSAGLLQAMSPDGVVVGEQVTLSVRPENVRLHQVRPAAGNVLEGEVSAATFLGEFLDCRVQVGGVQLLAREHPTVRVRPADKVFVEVPAELCTVLTDTHGVLASAYQETEDPVPAAR